MGIAPGEYKLLISGYKWPCDDQHIRLHKVGLIVTCSGYNPSGAGQKPEMSEYGGDAGGCQPSILSIPIAQRYRINDIMQVVAAIRNQWENGSSVLFHCNQVEIRSPAAVCCVLGNATKLKGTYWLNEVVKVRQVGNLLQTLHREVFVNNNPAGRGAFEVVQFQLW